MASYVLASLAYGLLLLEQSQLSSRAGVSFDILASVLVQESLMAVLLVVVAFAGAVKRAWRYLYVFAATVFASYAGLGVVTRFNATLELVVPLEAKGIPISDYQGTFYVLALVSAISYLLMILLLRRSYGKLLSVKTLNMRPEI